MARYDDQKADALTPSSVTPWLPADGPTYRRGIMARLGNYTVGLAASLDEVREAQRLRYKVFAEEFAADICSGVEGHDIDYYDNFCEHLLVRAVDTSRVVGTYRILPPHAARAVGEYYSEKEFRIDGLDDLRPALVEVGRSCVHRDYRNGAVIALLWSALARYMAEGNYQFLMGCASVGMSDGGHNAANLFRSVEPQNLAPPEYAAHPLNRLPIERLGNALAPSVPPLVKGYLRAGAWVCGEPAWDPQFNCADLLVLLPMHRMKHRYAQHFVKEGE